MDWVEETESRIGRGNRILFSRGSVCLKELANLVRKENHRTIVLWKLDLAEESVGCMKRRYPSETWLEDAVSAAREWVAGDTTMRIARRAILDCHAVARGLGNRAGIVVCHAIEQACGTVHTLGHAIGYPIYDLTSIVYRSGLDACIDIVEERIGDYLSRLRHWSDRVDDHDGTWAPFMLRWSRPSDSLMPSSIPCGMPLDASAAAVVIDL